MTNPIETHDRAREIVETPIERLKPSTDNPRTHSTQQIKLIARSIKRFGFVAPVLIDQNDRILAGHGRLLAAQRLGLKTVPTVIVDHLSEAARRAYLVADNRLAEKSGWDRKLLAVQLHEFKELGFELEEIGFEPAEVDIVLDDLAEMQDDAGPADRIPSLAKAVVTRVGDVWRLGRHRLACGDATVETSYVQVMEGQKAEFVFTDPPYNVRINGHVSGLGKTRHREFVSASGELSRAQFITFLSRAFEQLAAHTVDGSIHQICMDWRHTYEMLHAGEQTYDKLLNICVWNKTNAGMGSLYRSQHELVFVWQKGKGQHINNIELGRHGRSRSNVWTYAGVNTFKRGRMNELAMHPTIKPVALVADAIKDCSRRGGVVLDPFAGSGSVLIAAERTGRQARAIEMDPRYVDLSIRRWETFSGQFALHAETDLRFEEVEEHRMSAHQGDYIR